MQELSLNILDIVQNSVKAKASLITIRVIEDIHADTLTITIADNGCGMSEETAKAAVDPFYTTRTTRKVGLGLPFIKMAAEMTGGSFSIQSAIGVGTTVTAVFGLRHIDRMPLGDMCSTMLTLVSGSPQIDFVYTHLNAEQDFIMDTRQFKEILGDVPLNAPEILNFIKDYISENDFPFVV
ncbi:ATP-binding protein [Acetanaerobacterium elongatum]|uniref:histidine kinase n=1 Tax=Acetanaerobacterium elongatum TaxID=258515 RepID=A0A1G9USC1_9FIRM|nr:sensor histidine kinase [Acetanaerobacterium elongatum]SDM62495.1 Histidine kinase-, DNA gyrase B-, and HSP90-like ATPase [Acetanaerobacterium elongatum]